MYESKVENPLVGKVFTGSGPLQETETQDTYFCFSPAVNNFGPD